MHKLWIGLLASVSFVTTGCVMVGDFSDLSHPGMTQVTIQQSGGPPTSRIFTSLLSPFAQLNGGIMVFMVSTNTAGFRGAGYIPDEGAGSAISFVVPNGDYTSGGFGQIDPTWANSLRCGLVQSGGTFRLNGGSVTLNLDLRASYCSGPPFAPSPFMSGTDFNTLTLNTCGASSFASVTGFASNCVADPGSIGSVRLEFLPFRANLGELVLSTGSASMQSVCLSPVSATVLSTSARVPVGMPASPGIPTRIHAWTGGGCTGTYYGTFLYPNGLLSTVGVPPLQVTTGSATPVTKSFQSKIYAGGTQFKLFIEDIQ